MYSFNLTPIDFLLLTIIVSAAVTATLLAGRRLLGPVFFWEMGRLSRLGRLRVIRVGYAAALVIALYVAFPVDRELNHRLMPSFGSRFAELFLMIQSAAVMLFTPVYFGGAISDEKESRSLDFLLGTSLTA